MIIEISCFDVFYVLHHILMRYNCLRISGIFHELSQENNMSAIKFGFNLFRNLKFSIAQSRLSSTDGLFDSLRRYSSISLFSSNLRQRSWIF